MNNVVKGAMIATAVAGMFLAKGALAQPAGKKEAPVKCMGVNECKGKGACGVSGKHDCAGKNECKGKGWVEMTDADCKAKGGTVVK